jgi:hypothetical protein
MTDKKLWEAMQVNRATPPTPAWDWDSEDERMKPVVNVIHVLPAEDPPTLLHCAQSTCWCSPAPDPKDPQIVIHNSVCRGPGGWFLVGERLQDGDTDG